MQIALVGPAPPGKLVERTWQAASAGAEVVVLPALAAGPADDLGLELEANAAFREKLVRNLTGTTTLVATTLLEVGPEGPTEVVIVVSGEGVEARGLDQPAVVERPWGRLHVAKGDLDAEHVARPGPSPRYVAGGRELDLGGRDVALHEVDDPSDVGDGTADVGVDPGDDARDPATWRVVPMTQEHAEDVVGWTHPAPYEFYDTARFPEDLDDYLDPNRRAGRKAAVVDPTNGRELVGHVEWRHDDRTLTVGLGLRPDLNGRGLGEAFVRLVLDAALDRFDVDTFRLEVADWNQRAITVYERVGFERVGEEHHDLATGPVTFVVMERPAAT